MHAVGVGTSVKKTEPVTAEDEEPLWSSSVLIPNLPRAF